MNIILIENTMFIKVSNGTSDNKYVIATVGGVILSIQNTFTLEEIQTKYANSDIRYVKSFLDLKQEYNKVI